MYEIQVLKVGEMPAPGAEVYYMDKFGEWETLFFYIVVVRDAGRTIVINSGPPEDIGELDTFWRAWQEQCQFKRDEDEKTPNVLKKVGIDPNEVDYLLITPLTAYTTGNIDLFSKAQICLLKRGWIDFHAPTKHVPQLPRNIVMPRHILIHLVTDAWERVRLLEDEDEVLAGIRTFFTGVHHRSSMAICIKTAKGTAIFSDCFFKYANIEHNKPIGILESLEEAYISYARIREEADILIPGYDPEVLKRYPDGKTTEGRCIMRRSIASGEL